MQASRSIILCLASLVWIPLVSCASYTESIRALEKIHREPVLPPTSSESEMAFPFMEYASAVESGGEWDPIEDPVEYCLDHIQVLKDYGFRNEMEKADVTYILSMTAIRSPSQVVRASALRALAMEFESDLANFEPLPSSKGEEDPEAMLEKLKRLFELGRSPEGRQGGAQEEYTTHIMRLGRIQMNSAESAGKLLRAVVLDIGRRETEERAISAFRTAAARLSRWTFFRTVIETLADPAEVVRSVAIDALFLFPMDTIRPVLSGALERIFPLRSALHMIQILKNLKAKAAGPRSMGLVLLRHTVNSLSSSHAGVVRGALDVLQEVTGIRDENPSFWIQWFKTYSLKHAGEPDAAR